MQIIVVEQDLGKEVRLEIWIDMLLFEAKTPLRIYTESQCLFYVYFAKIEPY